MTHPFIADMKIENLLARLIFCESENVIKFSIRNTFKFIKIE